MNDEKFMEVVTYLKEHPDRHAQTVWTNIEHLDQRVKQFEGQEINCGTAACLAGTAAFMFAPVGTVFMTNDLLLPLNKETGIRPRYDYPTYAQGHIFWMNDTEAVVLFGGNRTIEEMEHYVSLPLDQRPRYLQELVNLDFDRAEEFEVTH